MLVHGIDAIAHQHPIMVLVAGQRLQTYLESFHDVLWPARGGGKADRHVNVNAVVGDEGFQPVPVTVGQRPPHSKHGLLN